jgi:uncharacterized glyoxalase superfamily protein PhnB
MLSVFLSCDDPYQTAEVLVSTAGWRLVFATPHESADQVACVALGDAEVMLSTADEQYLPAAAREHRGAGVTVYIRLPPTEDITAVAGRHAAAGLISKPLSERPWGELAFDAIIAGYRFLIGREP